MSLTKLDVLRYLSGNEGATVKDLALEFSYEEGSIRGYMNTLNSRGLVKKVKEDKRLTYYLTNSGKQRLDYLEEKFEIEGEENFDNEHDFDENLEIKINTGGGTKMARTVRYLEDGVYQCPSCGCKYDLESVTEGSDDSLCEECNEELEFLEPFEEEE